jgi:hypothetical protein
VPTVQVEKASNAITSMRHDQTQTATHFIPQAFKRNEIRRTGHDLSCELPQQKAKNEHNKQIDSQ